MQDNDSRISDQKAVTAPFSIPAGHTIRWKEVRSMACCGRLSISVCWLSRQGQERKSFIRNG